MENAPNKGILRRLNEELDKCYVEPLMVPEYPDIETRIVDNFLNRHKRVIDIRG